MPFPPPDEAIAATRKWLERAVIGLNLCPFAKPVHVKNLVRYAVSEVTDSDALLVDLERELQFLYEVSPQITDTTLLILAYVLERFDDFIDFLDLVEVVVCTQGLTGKLQVANFHPDYCFSDAGPGDLGNYTQSRALLHPAPDPRGESRSCSSGLPRGGQYLRTQYRNPRAHRSGRLASS